MRELIERLNRAAKTFGDSQAGNLYAEAAAALEAAREDAEDAARYRWLRSEAWAHMEAAPACSMVDTDGAYLWALDSDDLDAAIDQARGKSGPEAGQGGGE